jgi:hypothetical protein
MSKILVPFHITDYAGSPGSVQPGFKKFYLKNGYFKLFDGAAVSDVVLDRPLDGFVPLIGTITPSDTVLTAIEKLQYIITSISAGMVGPGTPNRVTKFVTPSTIGDSIIEDDGVSVIINRTSGATSMYTLDVNGTIYCDFGARNVINVPSAININMPYYNLPGGVPDASIININGKGPLANGFMTGYLVSVNGPDNIAFFADLNDSSLTSRGAEMTSHLLHTGYYIRLKKEIASTVYNDVFTVSHLGDTTAKSFIKIGGTSVQYLMADGSTSSGPSLTGYVPYTGATTTVNLGTQNFYADGSTGFGTTTPIAKVHIAGSTGLAFSTNTSNHGMAYIKTVVMDSLIAPYEGDLTFSAPYWDGVLYSFPERVRIAAHTGYLGINQTLPTQHLHVEGNSRITGAVYDSNNLPGTVGQYLSSTITGTSWTSLPSLTGFVPTSRTLSINGTLYDLTADRSWSVGTVTSVGITVPSAFNVTPSTITTSGTFAITGAGTASQYVRGDGQLATFPSGGGGGSSVNYYLNGSIAASVATYKQMSNTAIIGAGTDFSLTGNGLIAQFLTDAGNPNRLEIPGGAWNFEMFFSMSSSGGTPKFYVELLKYDGTVFTSIASSSLIPETISGGTIIDLYLTSLAVPTTPLLVTDRLAIRVYIINNSGGRTATLHTEDSHLCEIITTFSGGVTSLNGLTTNTQYLAVGTSGTDFNINSLVDTHTFNLPNASTTARGVVTVNNQSFSGLKNFTDNIIVNTIRIWRGSNNSLTNIGIGLDTLIDNTGNQNTILGYQSVSSLLSTSSFTTAIGHQSLKDVTGNNNTAVGNTSGLLITTGFQNTFIGAQAGGIVGQKIDASNSIAIGYQAITTKNNQIVLGTSNTVETILHGNTYIGTPLPVLDAKLTVIGNGSDPSFRVYKNPTDVVSGLPIFSVRETGRVGIGQTVSPDFKVEIRDFEATDYAVSSATLFTPVNENSVALSLQNAEQNSGGACYLQLGPRNSQNFTNYCYIGAVSVASVYAPRMVFGMRQGSTSYAEKMRINTDGIGMFTNGNPNSSAALEIASTIKGFLPPRMTNAQRIAIATPAIGLMVYCTDATEGLYINKSTGWTFII